MGNQNRWCCTHSYTADSTGYTCFPSTPSPPQGTTGKLPRWNRQGTKSAQWRRQSCPARGILHVCTKNHMCKFCRVKWESLATNMVTLILHWSFSSPPSGNYSPPAPPSTISGLYSLSASQTAPLSILQTACTGARESCVRWNTRGSSDITRWLWFGVFGWFGGGFCGMVSVWGLVLDFLKFFCIFCKFCCRLAALKEVWC